MTITAYVAAKPFYRGDQPNIEAVFPVINTMEGENMEDIIQRVTLTESVAYILAKEGEDKLYYKRTKKGWVSALPVDDTKFILDHSPNTCARCMGTGLYQAKTGFQMRSGWGNQAPICFACSGRGFIGKRGLRVRKEVTS